MSETEQVDKILIEHRYSVSSLKDVCCCGLQTKVQSKDLLNGEIRWREWVQHVGFLIRREDVGNVLL
jgi:hypothetical protein